MPDDAFEPLEEWLEYLDSHDGRIQRRLNGERENDLDIATLLPTSCGQIIFTVGDLRKLVEIGQEWRRR